MGVKISNRVVEEDHPDIWGCPNLKTFAKWFPRQRKPPVQRPWGGIGPGEIKEA